MSTVKLYPAVLCDNSEVLMQQLSLVSQMQVPVVHVDMLDGLLTDSLTLSVTALAQITWPEDLRVDLHLMVEEPLDDVYELKAFSQHIPIRRVIVQTNRVVDLHSVVNTITESGWEAGISLDPVSELDELSDDLLRQLGVIQVMGVEFGVQGQQFMPISLTTINEVTKLKGQLSDSFEISVDGGVNVDTAPKIIEAGAESLVVGSALWHSDDPVAAAHELQLRI